MKIFNIFFLLYFFLNFSISYAQVTDSLENIFRHKLKEYKWGLNANDSLKVGISNKLFPKEIILKRENDSFWNTAEFKLLLTGIAAFGTTTAVLKINADNYYDDYLITGNQNSLDKTRKLDLYSGISFGLLQLNFLYMLFKFLIF